MQTYWWYYRGKPITSARGCNLKDATKSLLHTIETCPGVVVTEETTADLLTTVIIPLATIKTFVDGKAQIIKEGL